MDPVVPYRFDPAADDFEAEHLVWDGPDDATTATWPIIGERIVVPEKRQSLEDYVAANNGAFTPHGRFGFTLGRYSEFLIAAPDFRYCAFKMGGIEASFGEATPLAAMIFWPLHYSKVHGGWGEFTSLRIYGARAEQVEAAFINAMTAYQGKFGYLPDLQPIWAVSDEEAQSDQEEYVYPAPPIITDLDPLRFFYNGLAQTDDIAACIYFYRTLEYFSFLTNTSELTRLRHDPSLSEADFSKKILDLISRDEKGPIFKLIASIADQTLLGSAAAAKLIDRPVVQLLNEAVYGFRNSIVHGKFSYGYTLLSSSVLQSDATIPQWRSHLQALARLALDRHGSRAV